MEKLLSNGATDLDCRDTDGNSLLHIVFKNMSRRPAEHTCLADMLLKRG